MTRCVNEVVRAARIPCGVNALRNDARAALGICAATGAKFLRVNVHVGAQLTDQGVPVIAEAELPETFTQNSRVNS